jgi:hypothetical protein
VPIHSLEFLHDVDAPRGRVIVVTRRYHAQRLADFGQVREIAASAYSRGERNEPASRAFRIVAFELLVDPDLPRWDMPAVTPMQAMSRAPLSDAQKAPPGEREDQPREDLPRED